MACFDADGTPKSPGQASLADLSSLAGESVSESVGEPQMTPKSVQVASGGGPDSAGGVGAGPAGCWIEMPKKDPLE